MQLTNAENSESCVTGHVAAQPTTKNKKKKMSKGKALCDFLVLQHR